MKLNPQFIYQTIGGDGVLVPVGKAAAQFHGVVRLNGTASFLVQQLKENTTSEALISALAEEYDGSADRFAADVERTLVVLREVGALIE